MQETWVALTTQAERFRSLTALARERENCLKAIKRISIRAVIRNGLKPKRND